MTFRPNFSPSLFIALLLGFLSPAILAKPTQTGDFAAIDHRGEFHQVSRYGDQRALVFMSIAPNCKADKAPLKVYRQLLDSFADEAVAFFLLDSANSNRSDLASYSRKQKIDVPVLLDDSQLISKTLGLHRSGEVAIVDPVTKQLIYRGPVNDALQADNPAKRATRDYVTESLSAYLSDKSTNDIDTQIASNGCAIDTSTQQASSEINFNRDIVPILEQRCVSCHREGGIGPFAMDSYPMIRGWAPMIREVVMSKRMPPGQIDPQFNHLFQDVAQLTIPEQQTLINWIDAGALLSGKQSNDKHDALADVKIESPEWQLGEPDLIVEVPAQEIPATGVIDYRYEKIPLNLNQDIWVKAVEFLPSAHEVMHHIIAFSLDTPDFSEFQLLTQGVGLGAYAPGNQPTVFPDNTGYKLSAGGGLFLQLHYTTSGKAAVDKTRIGMYLLKEPPAIAMRGGSAAEFNLNIPPNVKESPMTADSTFKQDSYLVTLSPHMHFRGKKIKYTLFYPDGKEEVILSVPNYQFNWQKNYDFKTPKFIPAGTRLVVDGAFDNSATNPNNPDPNITVTWGEQSWNEMYFGFYRHFEAQQDALTKR